MNYFIRIPKNNNNKLIIKYKNYNKKFFKLEFYSNFGKFSIYFLKQILFKFIKNKTYLILDYNKKIKYPPVIENNKLLIKLYYNLINNLLFSITGGYFIKFIIKGRGYSLNIAKNNFWLELKLGFSHLIKIYLPKICIIKKLNKFNFLIYSIDYEHLKTFAFILKKIKKIDNYKGKGLLFEKEMIKLKEGKKKY